MHWVDRGPAPPGLKRISNTYTPGWVDYYRLGIGDPPRDTRWREFRPDLKRVFHGLCAYCEELDRGEVEHFHPKKRWPELVYEWSNWLFACRSCNQSKGEKWPEQGYFDPGDRSLGRLLDSYFEFELLTGEIIPGKGLSRSDSTRVRTMIDDLNLNEWHHLRQRKTFIELLSLIFSEDSADSASGNPVADTIRFQRTSRKAEFSSIARAWLSVQGHTIDN